MRATSAWFGVALLGIVGTFGVIGCNDSPTAASAVSPGPLLRLTNVGARDIQGLSVLFPDERVEFGDVPAGSTSTYRTVNKGVYRDYPVSKGCTSPYAPIWINEMVSRSTLR